MRTFKEIKQDYRFTPEDERRLASLRALMEEHAEEIMSTVSLWFKGTKGAARFFTEEMLQKHVFASQKEWFLLLFSGKYDNTNYDKMIKIGMAHMRRNVDVHYLHRMANIIKNSCTGVLSKADDARDEMVNNIVTVGKIVDISLNVITNAYIEEEMRVYSPAYKVKSALINAAEKFSQTTNFILVFALVGLTLGVVWLFIRDVMHLFSGEPSLADQRELLSRHLELTREIYGSRVGVKKMRNFAIHYARLHPHPAQARKAAAQVTTEKSWREFLEDFYPASG